MVKKRKSGGRTGSSAGQDTLIPCDNCGRLTPRGKVTTVTRHVSFADAQIMKELRENGAILPNTRRTERLCVSCAIHSHKISIRPNAERRKHEKL